MRFRYWMYVEYMKMREMRNIIIIVRLKMKKLTLERVAETHYMPSYKPTIFVQGW